MKYWWLYQVRAENFNFALDKSDQESQDSNFQLNPQWHKEGNDSSFAIEIQNKKVKVKNKDLSTAIKTCNHPSLKLNL